MKRKEKRGRTSLPFVPHTVKKSNLKPDTLPHSLYRTFFQTHHVYYAETD